MTEENKTELELLKERADSLGVEYKSNVSTKTLTKLIREFEEQEEQDDGLTDNERIKRTLDEATKLVRVIITPMDSTKRDYQGDVFSAGNAVVPTMTKYIPFGVEWHVPQIILNTIKEKVMNKFIAKKDERGREYREYQEAKAYSIQELPPLTKEELQELAKSQEMRQAID
ncbi:hypothetical protein [Moraxella bovoculi]|uniref:hypothetical protein n=1 Tax=Moraxella bovoculi TaxID=386891 RepID=UPI00062464AB|nr:hypothetical protein [Moraxella bovoculi]AKG11541.1 hypothetical protein AAX07_05530 [Moraxella bovoculi]AKG13508.1 hypothetical protein AAX11_05060 [Moraxella bovoculi]